MTNNLAKIAKDLRAFAKRCKDVHYSDSLLISFILSGILSLASISFSDTFDNLSDSQKEAAMDSINEMRQQINYARKDNDKLIKGSSLELVKLMEQGDQVVKSPWGSQQFGFGYTYNSWGTSFKGRGGKQNDIKYRRTNDLTKYVYDPNLHEYGATNLHIKRNKEPDALVINPANVHKSYTPPTATRMDAMILIDGPQFNPNINGLNSSYYNYGFSTNPSRGYTPRVVGLTDLNAANNTSGNESRYSSENNSVGGTFVTNDATIYNTYYSGGTHNSSHKANILPHPTTGGSTEYSNITKLSGIFKSGLGNTTGAEHYDGPYTNTGGDVTRYKSYSDTYYYYVNVNNNSLNSYYPNAEHSGEHGRDMTYWRGTATINIGGNPPKNIDNPGTPETPDDRRNIILANNSSGLTIQDSKFYVERDRSIDYRNAIRVTSGDLNISNTTTGSSGYYNGNEDLTSKRYGTIFQIKPNWSNAIFVGSGGGNVNVSTTPGELGTTFTIDGNWSNGILMTSSGKTVTARNSTFNVNGGSSTGILMANNAGNADVTATFNVGTANNSAHGLLIESGTSNNTVNSGSIFNVTNGNGISLLKGTATVDGSRFNVAGGNGIYVSGNNSTLTSVSGSHFTMTGANTNGILKNTNTDTTVTGSTFDVNGAGSTGITYNGGSANEVIEGSTFNVNGRNNNTAGINMIDTAEITVKPKTNFYVNGSAIGIEVKNNGKQAKTIKFSGNYPVLTNQYETAMTLSGGNNVAVNIKGGDMNPDAPVSGGGATQDTKKSVTLKANSATDNGLDIYFHSSDNVGYYNAGYASNLEIQSGQNDKIMNTNNAGGFGVVKIGDTNNGYNNNEIFANQGYVKQGNIQLTHIELDGNNNTIAYFAKRTGSDFFTGPTNNNNGNVGFFGTTAGTSNITLQGVIGHEHSSDGNIAVYAESGQRDGMNTWSFIGDNTNSARNINLTDLKITDLNVGTNKNAKNTTLVFSKNGTVVEVANDTSATRGALIANTISDGTYNNGTANKWGYAVPFDSRSTNTTIAYATGIFDNNIHKFTVNDHTLFDGKPSEIKIISPVDMASLEGTAYRAKDGGKVTVDKNGAAVATRAGGYKSIIAYAEDSLSRRQASNDTTYPTTKKTLVRAEGSVVYINGNITAADESLFSTTSDTKSGRASADLKMLIKI